MGDIWAEVRDRGGAASAIHSIRCNQMICAQKHLYAVTKTVGMDAPSPAVRIYRDERPFMIGHPRVSLAVLIIEFLTQVTNFALGVLRLAASHCGTCPLSEGPRP